MPDQLSLLKTRRFLPLFVAQFLGAFNNNLFKNTLVAMLLYSMALHQSAMQPGYFVRLAAIVFIVPIIFLSSFGGQLADKMAMPNVIRNIALAGIIIAFFAAGALVSGSLPLLFIVLFLLGIQAALFEPSKLSLLPLHLKSEELIGGNALINSSAFIAILIGTLLGTVLGGMTSGPFIAAGLIVLFAGGAYFSARFIPQGDALNPAQTLLYNPFTLIRRSLKDALGGDIRIRRSIFGVAWFYFTGGAILTSFPDFARNVMQVDHLVLAALMVVFTIGIAGGGFLNEALLRGRVAVTYVPLAAFVMALCLLDLFLVSQDYSANVSGGLASLSDFFSNPKNWHLTFDLALLAAAGGLFVVPLSANVQKLAGEQERGAIMAAVTLMNAVAVVCAAIAGSLIMLLGFDGTAIFIFLAAANLAAAVYVSRLLPGTLIKSLLQLLFTFLYKVEVRGLEHYEAAGKRVVIISNHVSLLDAPLLAAFIPGKPMFAVHSHVAGWWWVKPFLKLVEAFPMDATNPFSTKSLIEEIRKDKRCIIFPEGRLTETGALMKVYEGPGMIADKADAMILPVRLDGVQHTMFARLKGKVPLQSFPKITITILPPQKFVLPEEAKGRRRRQIAGQKLYQLMEGMMFQTADKDQSLFQALLRAQHVNGDASIACADAEQNELAYKKLVQSAVTLGRKMAPQLAGQNSIGLMLPNSCGAVVTFFALQFLGRAPAMLNFSSGAGAMTQACRVADIKTVITSRRFVAAARLEAAIEAFSTFARVIYLEDVRQSLNIVDKLTGVIAPLMAGIWHRRFKVLPSNPALVLFTSGSEGVPKGVVLSHQNILSNAAQLSTRVDFNRHDVVFNALPMFHSFGLCSGTLLPILSGIKTVLYPSPLHYRIVPEMAYHANATIMFGTDTFLRGYARMAHAYDFYRVRYIFAGAEKVRDETRKLYAEKYGIRILEGYGATEAAPVIAVNSSMYNRPGTVGRLLAGMCSRLESVPGIEEGGRLYVQGPNIMLGYYLDANPGVLKPAPDGWHDTGDIVAIDDDGFITIKGRAKRFAKIAGEMVSLTAVEDFISKAFPNFMHAVIAVPDERKGEQLILASTKPELSREELLVAAREAKIAELMVPKTILHFDPLPLLGTGKTDYVKLNELVRSQLVAAS
jgi:acyl-[acyl-carrier-protein]-phospholipid O-acyltransferase/long-chain-fatty-acid--[acyl-carrier-protein] ligase